MTVSDRIALDPFGADMAAESAKLRALGPIVPLNCPAASPPGHPPATTP